MNARRAWLPGTMRFCEAIAPHWNSIVGWACAPVSAAPATIYDTTANLRIELPVGVRGSGWASERYYTL
jgi:hypothetical protein